MGVHSFRSAAMLAACMLLAGCFRSETPLIAPGEGDYPFQTVTYEEAGGGQKITLVRTDDGYRPADETTGERLLRNGLGDDTYLAQVEASEGEGPGYLYGIISLSQEPGGFVVAAGYAEDADIAAIRAGIDGLALCAEDTDTVCVESLDAYRRYAARDEVVERGTEYRILEMK
ncbi:MAG TPA: hypothetical protein VK862_16835 [Afifellaceae bacterium]|nr:hypothetical protein [Afifellaceae bacterium]